MCFPDGMLSGSGKRVDGGCYEIFPSFIYSGMYAAGRFAQDNIVLQEGDS